MKSERAITYSIIIISLFCVYLSIVIIPNFHLLENANKYKPKDTLIEKSTSFEGLVNCMNDYVASKCFRMYSKGIIEDFKIIFNGERSLIQLEK